MLKKSLPKLIKGKECGNNHYALPWHCTRYYGHKGPCALVIIRKEK